MHGYAWVPLELGAQLCGGHQTAEDKGELHGVKAQSGDLVLKGEDEGGEAADVHPLGEGVEHVQPVAVLVEQKRRNFFTTKMENHQTYVLTAPRQAPGWAPKLCESRSEEEIGGRGDKET